ncbi:MAG: type II toxin-antitoxin system VapC family toxin [Candidatus Nezhaarchaeales archaeon]
MEAARVIVDTDVLIDLLRGVKSIVGAIRDLESRGCLLATTVVNAFELFYGACKSRSRERNVASVKRLLGRLKILSLGLKSALRASIIHAELEAQGRPIGLRDVLIAAIALTRGYGIVTKNVKHFERIKELMLIPLS